MGKISKNKALLSLPIIVFIIYFSAGLLYDPIYIRYSKPLIIPTFLVYAIMNNRKALTLNYYFFVAFFYMNEVLLLFFEDSIPLFRTALITSFFCYLTLISLGYKAIKNKNLYTVPKGFTLFIFIINCVFLVFIIYLLISSISDLCLNIIIIFNALITVLLGVTAVLFLGSFTDKKTYFYFFGSFALIFNDIFAAIGTFFISNIVLNTLDRLLHFVAFYLIYLFVITESTNKNEQKELSAF
jgi:hypothetical protein